MVAAVTSFFGGAFPIIAPWVLVLDATASTKHWLFLCSGVNMGKEEGGRRCSNKCQSFPMKASFGLVNIPSFRCLAHVALFWELSQWHIRQNTCHSDSKIIKHFYTAVEIKNKIKGFKHCINFFPIGFSIQVLLSTVFPLLWKMTFKLFQSFIYQITNGSLLVHLITGFLFFQIYNNWVNWVF